MQNINTHPDTKLSGAVDKLEERDATRRDLNRLQSPCEKLTNFKKAKCEVLHLVCSNSLYWYRLGVDWIKNSPAEKDLGVLVDEKLNMSWQCTFAA